MALTTALRLSLLISIPAALGLGVFAHPILQLIYRGAGEAIGVATPALALLATAVVPAVLIGVIGSALQATGHTLLPIVAMGVGALVKLTVEIFLLPVSGIYIYAAPISTLACNLTVLLIESIGLARVLRVSLLSVGDLFRPLFAAGVSVGGSAALYLWLLAHMGETVWQMPLALLLAVLLYLILALRCRAVGREELIALPAGERLCHALVKIKLLK
jgi:stage V sporulation protein B